MTAMPPWEIRAAFRQAMTSNVPEEPRAPGDAGAVRPGAALVPDEGAGVDEGEVSCPTVTAGRAHQTICLADGPCLRPELF